MKILQVFNRYLERGGEEASVERISKTLSTRHQVVHCYFDSRQLGPVRGLEALPTALSMAWNSASAARFRCEAKACGAEVVLLHNYFPVGSPSILAEAFRLGLPVIYYVHNFRPFSVNGYLWSGGRVQTAGLRKNFLPEVIDASWQNSRIKTATYAAILTGMHALGMFRRVSAWVGISDFMRNEFVKAGLPGDDVFAIRHSWDIQNEAPARSDGDHYLFLGRLIEEKGVRVMLDAWKMLEDRLGENAPQLVIAGSGPLADEVGRASRQMRRVHFAGRVAGSEKEALIQSCRAMVVPSLWWEPLGLVIYEAYDYGKPALAARSGGLTETVQDGKTGFLHTPGNAAELADHVGQLDRDADRRWAMGQAGRDWLVANTGRGRWLESFDHVLAHARGRDGSPDPLPKNPA